MEIQILEFQQKHKIWLNMKRERKKCLDLKFSTIKTASVSEIFQYFSAKESVILNKEKARKEKRIRIIDREF